MSDLNTDKTAEDSEQTRQIFSACTRQMCVIFGRQLAKQLAPLGLSKWTIARMAEAGVMYLSAKTIDDRMTSAQCLTAAKGQDSLELSAMAGALEFFEEQGK
jgi:hypothetical protein